MGPVGRMDIRKGCRKLNVVDIYVLMHENGKLRPVEIIPAMGDEGVKENDQS
jgi:hypothetical protein